MTQSNLATSSTMSVAGCTLTATGIDAPADLPFDQWQQLGQWLSYCDGAVHWWIGDWLNIGEKKYGEKYAQAIEATGFDYQTLNGDRWVSQQIEFMRRRINLPFAHHRDVASLPPAEQDALLDVAEKEGLSRNDFRKRIAEHKQAKAIESAPAMPDGKYRTIVIDPPWPVEKIEREERPNQGRELDYSIMTLEDIAGRVGGMIQEKAAADGCHVYLWVTQRYLPAGLEFFKAWGVEYQCVMTWVKPTGMTPYSWMYNAEHVLFGRIGSLPLSKLGLKLTFEAPITRHSAKPDVFFDRVRQASPDRRISLYERVTREGFDVWGNEVPNG